MALPPSAYRYDRYCGNASFDELCGFGCDFYSQREGESSGVLFYASEAGAMDNQDNAFRGPFCAHTYRHANFFRCLV